MGQRRKREGRKEMEGSENRRIIGVDLTGILGGRMAGLTIKVLL